MLFEMLVGYSPFLSKQAAHFQNITPQDEAIDAAVCGMEVSHQSVTQSLSESLPLFRLIPP
jgi:hypothetical protein